jgi:hypothetical protein
MPQTECVINLKYKVMNIVGLFIQSCRRIAVGPEGLSDG